MSEAIELYHKDGRSAGVFYCSECRIVHKTEQEAAACHGERLCDCGKKMDWNERFCAKCSACRQKDFEEKERAKELERYRDARLITEAEYDGGMIYSGDRYYDSVEDLIEHCEAYETPIPVYVWACKNVGLPLVDISDITDRLIEEGWEDMDESDLYGVDELNAAIDAFNEANRDVAVYQADYSTAIKLDAQEDRKGNSDE